MLEDETRGPVCTGPRHQCREVESRACAACTRRGVDGSADLRKAGTDVRPALERNRCTQHVATERDEIIDCVIGERVANWIAVLGLGFVLGMRHATDPDHVLAVATIVTRHRRIVTAAWVGIWWGIGHTLTLLLVGGGMVLLGWVIPPRLGLSMEFSVGLMLILLGAFTLVRAWGQGTSQLVRGGTAPDAIETRTHRHGDYIHSHPGNAPQGGHPHPVDRTPLGMLDRHFGEALAYRAVRPLVVGMVHGLAGSAAVALLVLATIASPAWSMLYLLLFGVGTVAGMMLITAAIALPFRWSGEALPRLTRALAMAAGVAAIGFGCLLAWQIGWVDGLFTANPTWTPH